MNNSSQPRFIGPPQFVSPLDLPPGKITLIVCYGIVFSCCFFGNLLVLGVILRHRKLRSVTNFFLANLAVADLGVGVFCVLPNLSLFLSPTWHLGRAMCKIYYFVQQMSYTASIVILATIAMERHLAIVHPLKNKRWTTMRRLRVCISLIWTLSAIYGLPQLVIYDEKVISFGANSMNFCVPVIKFNVKAYVTFNFIFLYVCPLAIITALYGRICLVLWRSTKKDNKCGNGVIYTPKANPHGPKVTFVENSTDDNEDSISGKGDRLLPSRPKMRVLVCIGQRSHRAGYRRSSNCDGKDRGSSASNNTMVARRRVIRLLVAVVVSFAVLVLPYQVRAMWQFWTTSRSPPIVEALLPPITFILLFMNSGVNPFLYAILSENFRQRMAEALCCRSPPRSTSTEMQSRTTVSQM